MSPRRGQVLERVRIPAVESRLEIDDSPVVELGPTDTIDLLLRAIRTAGARSVRIVAPQAGRALGSHGRIAMLAYFLREEGYRATLVTPDRRLAALARHEGIPVREPADTESVFSTPLAEPAGVFERIGGRLESTVPADRLPRHLRGRPFAKLPLLRLAALAIVLVAAYLAFMYFVRPSSSVIVTPHAAFVPIEVTVSVDPDVGGVDLVRRVIPAVVVQAVARDSLSKPTTGRRREAESSAAGRITFRNRTRGALLVPRGTRVRTAGGTAFLTDSEVLVPPTLPVGGQLVPGEAAVAVRAEQPGPDANVPALALVAGEGPIGPALDVFNPRPLIGGSEREVALVSQRDRDELSALLGERLRSAAVERLKRERPENQTVVVWSTESGNPEFIEQTFSAELDERAPVLTLELTLRARGTAFATEDLQRVLAQALATVPGSRVVAVDRIRVIETEVLKEELGVLQLRVQAVGEAVEDVDADAIRAALTGRPVTEGLNLLARLPGVAAYDVTHEPANPTDFPRLGLRIDVQIAAPQSAPSG